ncbi:MAG: class I SAM-dependent methyltransferase [Acidobacteria bacterium]|nr:class I SAM-dependent methyltransferase [Acidobacteriota bacterium]
MNRNDQREVCREHINEVIETQLTTPGFWDQFWHPKHQPAETLALLDRLKKAVKGVLGEKKIQRFSRPYSDYVLWEHIYPKYLPAMAGARVLEIGSAPGHYLVRLAQTFGCIPYGVEYSPAGFKMNQQIFAQNDLDPNNIIFANAFGDEFQSAYRASFDVVVSRGVVEHFSDIEPILAKHCALLKPGGSLVVSVPNFRGLAYFLALIFDKASLQAHNLEIMRISKFATAFATPHLQSVFCGYYGVCDVAAPVSGPNAKQGGAYSLTFQLIDKTQVLLNGLLRLTIGGRSVETAFLSPFLLYIGKNQFPRPPISSQVAGH